MKIAIIGMGVVGNGMARLLENQHEVIGYDPVRSLVTREEVNQCDMAIICVPTNELPDGSADISIVEDCVSWLTTPLILIKSTVPQERRRL
jgi:UDP-glucose 6-dehydrogenase